MNTYKQDLKTAERESDQYKLRAEQLEQQLKEMADRKAEAEDKLSRLRKTGSKLIRSLNEVGKMSIIWFTSEANEDIYKTILSILASD